MKIVVIVAMSDDGLIGRAGGLPWHLSADLVRFKKLTMGHSIVMGRKTYESIGRPLPGRTSVVVSRQPDYRPEGVTVAGSLAEALELCRGQEQVFIIGGAEVYRQALPLADELLVTRVHGRFQGDTYFPSFDTKNWQCVERTDHVADEKNPHDYTFEVYRRVPRTEAVHRAAAIPDEPS